ncbi:MAG TPA: DMT family transporter [Candidatus Thermoplasmatota archaeon]|nr:DMT family transporter [Candidatus Thermoplasmatota archaeon]
MARRFDRVDGAMALLIVVWGSAFAGIRALGEVLDPYEMTWFRYAPFPLLYGAWLAWRGRTRLRTVSGNDWVAMALLGAVGVLGYHFALNWGLHDSALAPAQSAATGAILVATTPLFTLLIALVSRQERLRMLAVAGSLAAFAGVGVVAFLGQGPDAKLAQAQKALVVLIAPLSWAVYTVGTKPLVARYGGIFVTAITLGLGSLTLVPLGLSYGVAPLGALEPVHWFWLLFLAFLSTAAGYAVWNWALQHRSASELTSWVYLNPVVAAAVGFLFLGERLTPWFVAGAALVLGGVVLVNRARLTGATRPAVPAADQEA